jgi:peptidoglycan hydrolase FlgJ
MTQISGNSPITGAAASARPVDPALQKAAKAFEAIFVRQMIGAMRSASLSEGMLDSGATEQFRDMSDARTAENMAQSGAMGIADILLKQLSPLVPAGQTQPSTQDETP